MTVDEYRDLLHEDVAIAASANISNQSDEFLALVTGILEAGEEFDDFVDCYYEGVSKRKANMRIDGYALDDTDGSCCIFITDYRGPYEDDSIREKDITSWFKKIRYFITESVDNRLYKELEESTEAYGFSKMLYEQFNEFTKFRLYLLTDAFNKQRVKTIKDEQIEEKTVELNVWDIVRIFDVVSSKAQKESVDILLKDFGIYGIPCVKAVEYEDVVADIELNQPASDLEPDEPAGNVISYSSYLAVFPGTILNELYLEYGSRLLEGNVRSFLSVRGKVNKGIQNTIKNYPEMFFAYNNGIAATATEIDCELTQIGLVITRIKDLQIVNGGQTTASIANTLLTKKKDETVELEKVFVPMKLSVLEQSMSEKIIPKISEYSNSQNPVSASDFFSNHPFHIRMEDYSRKTPAPSIGGNQYQSYWYYERARGQYNQGKMKFRPRSSQLRQYETRYPANQVIKLVELAKYMELYFMAPHIASKGKQAIVKDFSEKIKKQWDVSDIEFNKYYYKRVVALAIIFKKTDSIIKETDWYKSKKSYKANVVAYTMSVLFYLINTNFKDFELDFMRIWNAQDLYPELADQIRILCTQVYAFITRDDRLRENVTEWCKREECWKRAKQSEWTLLPSFSETLIPKTQAVEEKEDEKENRKLSNEVDAVEFIMSKGSTYWEKVFEWGNSRRLFTDTERSILRLVVNMERTGRVPSDRQIKIALKTREKLIDEGMPIEFTS